MQYAYLNINLNNFIALKDFDLIRQYQEFVYLVKLHGEETPGSPVGNTLISPIEF